VPAGSVVDAADGRPLAGVVVSDGFAVTRTGSNGSFSFTDRTDAEFVFVSVPSTHRALESGWFADVRGGADGALEFALAARGDAGPGCRFVQVTDLHVSVDGGARLRPLIEAGVVAPEGVEVTGASSGAELRDDLALIVERVNPDFVMATGDLADYGQPEELRAYRAAITGLGAPVASVPGNHDHLSCLTREAISEFFADWATREDKGGLSAGEAFQREVFGGDWRRAASGRAPWVDEIGPLYYSFDWGGVHFVAYDGEGLRRYGDDYPQDEWLAADLAAVPAGVPVVVCTHFPETREFYAARFGGVRLVASISGHWHGTRIWTDGEASHWTSSTLGFGGIDFTPRGYRVIEVDDSGARSWWETVEAPNPPLARVAGQAAVVDERVVVALEEPDGRGSIQMIDGWTTRLPSAARSGVAAAGDLVFALDLGSRLHALDADSGGTRWSCALGDPSVRWCLGVPVVADDAVYVGSAMSVHAFDAADGSERWRTDLASADWAASWAGVAVSGDAVVIGAASDDLHLAALDRTTGSVRWRRAGRDIAGVSAPPVIAGGLVLAASAPGWLAAYDLGDGSERWMHALDDAWPVALVLAGGLALVRSSTGRVTAHELADGSPRWTTDLGPGPRSGRPYSRVPGGARLPIVAVGDRFWTATADEVVELDLESGLVADRVRADSQVATLAVRDGAVVAVTADGHAP
jgi:outer membrane protein assembly factor BamB/predicted MPP superfamily phosphohydrolase